jgi:hypothetical protein
MTGTSCRSTMRRKVMQMSIRLPRYARTIVLSVIAIGVLVGHPAGRPIRTASAQAPNNYVPIGSFDYADFEEMRGWTCGQDQWTAALEVHIYASNWDSAWCQEVDGERVCLAAGGTANRPGDEVLRQMCGGTSEHAFEIATPAGLDDGQAHKLYAYALNIDGIGQQNGTNPLLANSPRLLPARPGQCGPEGTTEVNTAICASDPDCIRHAIGLDPVSWTGGD